jgi:hypothetical protein
LAPRFARVERLRLASAIRILLALGLLAGSAVGCGADTAGARFSPGLVSTADHRLSAAAAAKLGAAVVRVEFDIGTPVASMRGTVDAITRRGARPLLLAGFHGRVPSRAEASNLGRWAAEFGPGGRFWTGSRGDRRPVRLIEFGNETSYRDQYADAPSDESYGDRAELYARRFATAHSAIARGGRRVGLLAQADDGGTGSATWVNHMFEAVPRLGRLAAGWTVHPYGPRDRWEPKLRRLVAQTEANGASADIPIDVTEYGLSSDAGAALTDNYGWPADQTYAEAASALEQTVAEMRDEPAVGGRLRLFMVYAAHDLRAPGATRNREAYFGALRHDLRRKGAYTAAVRDLFGSGS